MPDLPADVYLDRLCERLDEEMQRWGVLYHSEVLGLFLQKAGWIGFCMVFEQKGQAASLIQKLYQSPLLSEAARSFVLNHVGAIINTYVVTALERQQFHEHRRCLEAQLIGVNLCNMENWYAFEEDIPIDDEEREVVNPYHPTRRVKRAPSPIRFGGMYRSYQGYSPLKPAGIRGVVGRPRVNTGTKPRVVQTNNLGGAKPPHVQTVLTKNGKQVDVNNNQVYVSSKVPQGAIPIQNLGGQPVKTSLPALPLATPTKIQPSTNSWGMPSSVLPGSNAGKAAGLPGSKTSSISSSNKVEPAPVSASSSSKTGSVSVLLQPSKQTSLSQTKRTGTEEVKTKTDTNVVNKPLKSSGPNPLITNNNAKLSFKTNPRLEQAQAVSRRAKTHQYLKTEAFLHKRQQVIRAYGIKAPRSKVSEQKYLRAMQLQRRLYRQKQIQNPLHTSKMKQSNRDSVADLPENPQHMMSSAKTLANWLDRHPRWDNFVGGLGNMASNAVAFSISGVVAVTYTKGVWGPKEQAVKKTLEQSNEDQPYSLLTDPTTNTTYAVKPDDIPQDAVAKKKFEEDQKFQREILARAAVPVDPEVERRITEVLRHQDEVNKLWQQQHNLIEPTPSFVGNEHNPSLEQAIEAARYNPHAMKLKSDPMGYEEELEADSTQFLLDNIDELSLTQKVKIKQGDDLGEKLYGMIRRHRNKIWPPPPPSDDTDLALLAGGGNTLWK